MKYSYLIVEGYHDLEVVACLLKLAGLTRKKTLATMEKTWHYLVQPNKPSVDDNTDLLQRPKIPAVFENSTHSILVSPAEGIKKIKAEKVLLNSLKDKLTGVGVILDTDPSEISAAAIFNKTAELFKDLFSLPAGPGEVGPGKPNFGIYLIPDNKNFGAIEKLLLSCAQIEFPDLKSAANSLIENITQDAVSNQEKRFAELRKPFGKDKATIGIIGNIFRPCKSIQASIADNFWFTDRSIQSGDVGLLLSFIKNIVEL